MTDQFNLISVNNQFKILQSKSAKFKIDKKNKIISIVHDHNMDKTVFFGEQIDNWKIEFNFNYLLNNSLESLEENNLIYEYTGCVNFVGVKIIDLELDLKNSFCEDAVNFINVNGNIKSLIINNSISDAMDADFSNLTIEKIQSRIPNLYINKIK